MSAGTSCRQEDIVRTPEGLLVCSTTGEVLDEDPIVSEPEWRVFKDGSVSRAVVRAGTPLTHMQHDYGIGVKLEPKRSQNPLKRAGKIVRRLKEARVSKREIYKVNVLQRANEVAEHFNIPRVARETMGLILQLYMKQRRISSSRETDSFVAAALLKAIEIHNLDVSQHEVYDYLGVKVEEVWAAKRKLSESGVLARLKPFIYRKRGFERQKKRVATYVSRIISSLGLPNEVYHKSLEFIEVAVASGKNLYGKRPETLAAAAVYLTARIYGYEHVNQSSVARAVGIKESNVRKIYRYLLDGMVVLVAL